MFEYRDRLLLQKYLTPKIKFSALKLVYLLFIPIVFLFSACDSNPLGGSKSEIKDNYEPGKRTQSEPPTISAISNFTMDENDIQSVPFTINDPDTFLMCSNIFVKATSANGILIDYNGFTVTGAYPNCSLKMQPKAFQYGVSTVKVELFDFWTIVSSTFQLTVLHVVTPGVFGITDAEGIDRSVVLDWTGAAYMTGSSARYSIFYRETGSTGAYTQITPAKSPHTVTGLVNNISYDFYIRARNSAGSRDSAIAQATPTKYKVYGGEFVAGTNQEELSVGASPQRVFASTGDKADKVFENSFSGKFRVYLNSQGNILSGVNP
jgi:Fibronectin type III domain